MLSIAVTHGGYVPPFRSTSHAPATASSPPPNLRILNEFLFPSRFILVDSTRAGKRLPDALSKTVPIWCAVVNRALRLRQTPADLRHPRTVILDGADNTDDDDDDDAAGLYTPPGAVSPYEHVQIAARLDGWAASLAVRVISPVYSDARGC